MQVRHARHSIRSKGNDLTTLINRIERGLHNLHAQARETCSPEELSKSQLPSSPFARVLVVLSGSPADSAGLKVGDTVTKFGSVTRENFESLKNISDVGENSRGRPVDVVIVRDGTARRLRLTPGTWSGAGLLGFKIRPVVDEESVDR